MNPQPMLGAAVPKLQALGTAIALVCSAGVAAAAPSSSSVEITSFSYSISAGGLTWSDPYQSFQTRALDAGGLLGTRLDGFDAEDYGFGIASATSSQAAAAASTALAQTFLLTASTTASVGPAVYQPNNAQASASQSGAFILSGPGSVTFNVGYLLKAASPGGNAIDDYGQTTLSFNAANSTGSSGGTVGDRLLSFGAAASKSGTLTMTVSLLADETGFYGLNGNAIAFSPAAVPEPGQWALMTAGLLGIAVWSRRRKAAAAS